MKSELIKIYTEGDGKYCSILCPFFDIISYDKCFHLCRLFNCILHEIDPNRNSIRDIVRSSLCKSLTIEKNEVNLFNLLSISCEDFNVILYRDNRRNFCTNCYYCCDLKECKKYNCILKKSYPTNNAVRCDKCLHDICTLIEENSVVKEDLE